MRSVLSARGDRSGLRRVSRSVLACRRICGGGDSFYAFGISVRSREGQRCLFACPGLRSKDRLKKFGQREEMSREKIRYLQDLELEEVLYYQQAVIRATSMGKL